MKRIPRVFLIMFLTCIFPNAGLHAEETPEAMEGPFVIHDLALDPGNPDIVYAITSNYGVLKSTDAGQSWARRNEGLRSYTHHALAVDPRNPGVIYVGAWGGGVSKSVDGGLGWTEINSRLGNTAIEKIAIHPENSKILYAATSSGVFRSPDGGGRWLSFSEGLPLSGIGLYQGIFAVGKGPVSLFLSTNMGLFTRIQGRNVWERVSLPIKEGHPTQLTWYPETGDLFLGTLKNGVLKSRDKGLTWLPVTKNMGPAWVTDIDFDPLNPQTVYISTRMKGILKSVDGGKSWEEMNKGVPGIDVRCLVIHPKNPKIIYAGTPHDGVLKTSDGGGSWIPLKGFPVLKMSEIIDPLDQWPDKVRAKPKSIPPGFFKCNQCHGWADPHLNAKRTYWRVPANDRDWAPTVARMKVRARLTLEEERNIVEFLNAYTKP